MKKFIEWTQKPITWGAWLKMALAAFVITVTYCAGVVLYILRPEWLAAVGDFFRRVFTKKSD